MIILTIEITAVGSIEADDSTVSCNRKATGSDTTRLNAYITAPSE